MHAVRVGPRVVMVLGLLAAIGVSGCRASSAGPVAATASPPASLAASAPASLAASASAPAIASSAAPMSSGGVQNLIVSAAVRSELLAAYAADKRIPASDVRGVPGSVYYAYVPATATYWAMATYGPVSTDSLTVEVGFQDGGSDGLFKKTGSGPWQVTLGGEPVTCEVLRFYPQAVLQAWSMPTSATPASMC
jgi:hypothetical protein